MTSRSAFNRSRSSAACRMAHSPVAHRCDRSTGKPSPAGRRGASGRFGPFGRAVSIAEPGCDTGVNETFGAWGDAMPLAASANSGARLDALPMSSFHRRVLWLIGAGMFFDSFDIYLAGGVLGAMVKSGFSDIGHNASFISATF